MKYKRKQHIKRCEPTALGRLKVHLCAEGMTLEIHPSLHSLFGYRVAIECCTPVKGGLVSLPSFPCGWRSWGS